MTATSHGTARAVPRLQHRLPHRLPSASCVRPSPTCLERSASCVRPSPTCLEPSTSRVLPSYPCLEWSAFCVRPSLTSPPRSAPERSSTWVAPSSRRRSPRSADDVVTATSRVLPGLPTSCRRPLIGSGRTLTCLLPRTRARPSSAHPRPSARPVLRRHVSAVPQVLAGTRPVSPGHLSQTQAPAPCNLRLTRWDRLWPPITRWDRLRRPVTRSDRLRMAPPCHPTPAPQASRPSRPGRPRHPAPAPQAPQPPLLEGDRQMITSRSDASAPGAAR